ncbi:MAG TPA: YceI family protein [Polyangiaceae bacterium]|nr:YceI family protein [Polyangiaceae bacterium]
MLFKMRSAYLAAVISSVLTVAAVASAKYGASNAKIQVHAKGPAGMSIDGTSSTLKVDEDDKNVTFKTYLNTIDTKNSGRNGHMQQRLGRIPKKDSDGKPKKNEKGEVEMEDHFEIRLTVPKDKLDPNKGGTVDGTLNFHDMSKPVSVKYEIKDKHVSASFGIDVLKHGVKEEDLCFEPKTKSICAKAHVDIEVEFDLKS